MILATLRVAAALSLLILPGAWVAFAMRFQPLSFYSRLALSGVLSPCIAVGEFYLIRLAGVPYTRTVGILVILNLVSAWFVIREWRRVSSQAESRPRWPSLRNIALFLLLVACISVPWTTNPTLRMFKFHSWMHLSLVNQFPSGALVPEEPELAGIRLAYPWLGHAYWAVLSSAGALPFTKIYVLTNLAFLAWTCILVYETSRLLGATPAGSRAALLWLALGTNVFGFWIWKMTGWLPGDIRYTPWLRKFVVCGLSAFVLGMLAALMLVGLAALQARTRDLLVMTCVLTASVGLFYAVLLPAAAGLGGAIVAVVLLDRRLGDRKTRLRDAVELLAGLALAVLASAAFVRFVSVARVAPPVTFPGMLSAVSKTGTGLIALLAFLPAIAFVLRRRGWKPSALVLILGAAISFGLRSLVHIGGAYNEYKLMFPAALFLAPLVGVALVDWPWKKISADSFVLCSALLLLPTVVALDYKWQLKADLASERVEESGLGLALRPGEPDAAWISAVRAETSPETILVVHRSDLFLPALMDRSMLGPPEQTTPPPGYWELSRFNLVDVRGYSPELVDGRLALISAVYSTDEKQNFESVYRNLMVLARPVAIRFAPGDGITFLSWLRQNDRGHLLYRDNSGLQVWLINP